MAETATVAGITVACYLIGMLCKATDKINDKFIPVIVGMLGAALGIAGWLTISGFPATTWLSAIEVGIVSGLASTGANQIYKQLTNTEA